MSNNIQGKVVVITGASSGIGAATASRLAREGAKVVLGARREGRLKDQVREITKDGGEAIYRTCDVTNRTEVEALVKAAVDEYGQIDVMFNNAGLMPLSFVKNKHIDEWEQMVDVNIKGVLYGTYAVMDHFMKHGGHLINTCSVAGHKVMPAGAVYCGTKHFVRAFSEGLRMETAGKVRVTMVSPGAVETELTEHITDEEAIEMFEKMDLEPIDSDAIARAVTYAIEQPDGVSVNDIIVRPTGQPM